MLPYHRILWWVSISTPPSSTWSVKSGAKPRTFPSDMARPSPSWPDQLPNLGLWCGCQVRGEAVMEKLVGIWWGEGVGRTDHQTHSYHIPYLYLWHCLPLTGALVSLVKKSLQKACPNPFVRALMLLIVHVTVCKHVRLTSLAANSVLNQAAGDLHMHVQMVGLCLAAVARWEAEEDPAKATEQAHFESNKWLHQQSGGCMWTTSVSSISISIHFTCHLPPPAKKTFNIWYIVSHVKWKTDAALRPTEKPWLNCRHLTHDCIGIPQRLSSSTSSGASPSLRATWLKSKRTEGSLAAFEAVAINNLYALSCRYRTGTRTVHIL